MTEPQWEYRQQGRDHYFWRPGVMTAQPPTADWFTADFWAQYGPVETHGGGRHPVYMVTTGEQDLVLRHYYRGGLPGKIIRRRFQWQGLDQARSAAEFKLLCWLRTQQLPVPDPVAARVRRTGLLGYEASILIHRIPHSQNLLERLRQGPFSAAGWQAVGATIARFHQAGVFHSDLNCRNILVQADPQVWLIDFDKCGRREPASEWQQQNLARLLRSLRKERERHPDMHWQEQDWQALSAGYDAVDPVR